MTDKTTSFSAGVSSSASENAEPTVRLVLRKKGIAKENGARIYWPPPLTPLGATGFEHKTGLQGVGRRRNSSEPNSAKILLSGAAHNSTER
jgi:hypothetical protein